MSIFVQLKTYINAYCNTSFAGVYLQHGGDRERRVSVRQQEHLYLHQSYKYKVCKWEQVQILTKHIQRKCTSPQIHKQHTRLWHLTHVSLFLLGCFPQECAGEEDVQAVRWRSVSVTSQTDQRGDTQERYGAAASSACPSLISFSKWYLT